MMKILSKTGKGFTGSQMGNSPFSNKKEKNLPAFKLLSPLFAVLLLICALLSYTSPGKTIPINTLKIAASNFLESIGVNQGSNLTIAYTGTGNINGTSATALYVFKPSNGKGWVILSADDQVKPVLAYSDNSVFDAVKMAPSTAAWIHGYENQIAWAILNSLPARPETSGAWNELLSGSKRIAARTTSAVAPMLTTTWDQEPYYNDLCPYDATYGMLTATGCVATAMAQVMKYWNWPVTGCGSYTYSESPYGNLSANFGATDYQWSSMPAALSAPNTAIATLMYQVGVSVEMDYGTDYDGGSGAYVNTIESGGTPCAEFALKANFHYKQSLHSLIRYGEGPGSGYDSIAEATWISKLEADLNLGHPIIYAGASDSSSVGGHCWVCDGYNSSDFFHFNWGWSGNSDGYYTVDNLAPPALGVGGGGGNFNFDQTAIVGIVPDSFPSNPGNIKLLSYLNTSVTPAQYGQPFSVTTKILNSDTTTFSGDFCAQIFDSANNFLGTLQSFLGETLAPGDSTSSLTFASPGMYNLQSGLYGVRIYYRLTGTTSWTPVANNGNYYNFTYLAFYNDTDIALALPVAITPGFTLYQTQYVSVSVPISDWGTNNFIGTIEATLNSITDGSQVFLIQSLPEQNITLDSTASFTFSNGALTVPTGQYMLEIRHQYGGVGNLYLTASTFATNPTLVNVVAPNATRQVNKGENITIYPNPATDKLYINLNSPASALITIMDMEGRQINQTENRNMQVVTIPLNGFAPGIYLARIQTGDGVSTLKFVISK